LPRAFRGTDGVVLDSPPLTIGGNFTSSLAVVAFGGRWLVAYQNNATHDNPIATTQAAFVNADGTHLPEFTAYGSYSTSGGNGLFKVAMAAGSTTAIVVQSAELSSGVETDLVARLINVDGSLGTSFNMTPWIGNQYNPSATWDGNQFVIAYMDQKNRFAPWTLDQLDARGDIFAMRISAAGKIRDPQGFAFSLSQASEAQPNIAGSRGIDWITGSILRNQDPFATYRLGYDLFGLGGNQWPVATASASSTGGDIPLTVTFSSTGSTDPNGSITGYLWDFGDGSTSTDANPAHTFTTPGNYVVTGDGY
jgi:PKD repeat protein